VAGITGDPFFFVHVMKTGGSTFRQHVRANFLPAERYPDDEHDANLFLAKLSVSGVVGLPAERHARTRIYTGHFPYCVSQMLGRPMTTLTILRDPVERTISHLKQEQASGPAGRSLEEAYDDPQVRLLVDDHQVRMFAFTPEDGIETFAEPLPIDEARFALACDNLSAVHLVGLQERFDAFLDAVVARYGWVRAPVGSVRVSEPVAVSDALRERIIRDSSADIAFYEFARGLVG
jgi:hypothetical protein